MTRAPWALAIWRAKRETPPVPRMRTVSPARRRPFSTRAFQAVRAAQGRVAAWARLRWAGARMRPDSGKRRAVVKVPSMTPPRADLPVVAGWISPSCQDWKKRLVTWSPTLKRVTFSPMAVNDACAVGAGDAGEGHLGVVGAEDGHEVAEVEAGEVEVDEDFVGAGGGDGGGGEGEVVDILERAEGVDLEGGGLHEGWMWFGGLGF